MIMRYVDLLRGKKVTQGFSKKTFAREKWDIEAYFLGAMTAFRRAYYEKKGMTNLPDDVEEGLSKLLIDYYLDATTENELREAIRAWIPELKDEELNHLVREINQQKMKPKAEVTITTVRWEYTEDYPESSAKPEENSERHPEETPTAEEEGEEEEY
jgi:demethoxyubiquinone hydroxylase (CLK1/Coq7/Cat5 family)